MTLLRWAAGCAAIVAASFISLSPPARAQEAMIDDSVNKVIPHAPYPVSARAKALHATIPVADLHADPLLWKRDLVKRNTIGHIDIPRLREGGYALQLFSVVSKSPKGEN